MEISTSRSLLAILRANLFTLFNGVLVGAIVLVLVFGHLQDVVFGGVMVINAIIGVAAEWRAKRTLDALAIVDAPRARVVRDGHCLDVHFEDVVLGDLVELRAGDQVCVDGEVVDAVGLEIDESLLTGESEPVRKTTGGRVLAGTGVVAGSGRVRTTAVGADLWAQGITREARAFTRTVSEIQVSTNRVLRVIAWMLVPMVLVIAWSQMRLGGASETTWNHAIVLAVAGVVGMVPQGLVLLTSMNFALGSATLARRGVLVQELPAVEVLARVDSLCLDKTGTLTTGGIRLRGCVPLSDHPDLDAALLALAGDGTNATAQALLDAGPTGTGHLPRLDADATPVDEAGAGSRDGGTGGGALAVGRRVVFSSARKWSAVEVTRGDTPGGAARADGPATWVLGAPEMLLDAAPDTRASTLADSLAARGLRVLALAHSPHALPDGEEAPALGDLDGLTVLALVAFEEDLRDSARATLDWFAAQGVRVRVISGDSPRTVAALAARVGLTAPDGGDPVAVDARTLPEHFESEEFAAAVLGADVFGRVTPEQKRAMVHALRRAGHCVAMTGDGVNDTLALKDADLGIAMGNGAPATKAVSRLVLVDSDFSVLPGVVAEGRRIIANMERVSALFLAKTTYSVVLALVCAAAVWPYPFLPRNFTYIDVWTIGVPAFFIALGPNTRRYVPGFLRRTLGLAVPSGVILAAAMLVPYGIVGPGTDHGRTAATLTLMAGALWLLSITARPLVAWRVGLIALMAAGAVAGVVIPVVRHFFALDVLATADWTWVGVCALAACLLVEISHRVHHGRLHRAAEEAGRTTV